MILCIQLSLLNYKLTINIKCISVIELKMKNIVLNEHKDQLKNRSIVLINSPYTNH